MYLGHISSSSSIDTNSLTYHFMPTVSMTTNCQKNVFNTAFISIGIHSVDFCFQVLATGSFNTTE